jgi:hypothetical protein
MNVLSTAFGLTWSRTHFLLLWDIAVHVGLLLQGLQSGLQELRIDFDHLGDKLVRKATCRSTVKNISKFRFPRTCLAYFQFQVFSLA